MPHILIVEDDLTFATMMQTWLRKKGFDVDRVSSVSAAARQLTDTPNFDLILSDLRLPDHDGLFLLEWMRKHNLRIPFIVMTSYAEVQNAVLAMKTGASDYIAKPVQPDILLQKIRDALSTPEPAPTPQPATPAPEVKAQEPTADVPRYIEGKSEASRQLYEYVGLVAPTPMSVLILGASGTGKEYVARRIHELSPRRDKPFFALDCGAIPKEVAASEFFGYVKGTFTGATTDKTGAFVEANGGTLFLDEVGNLSYDVQVQLLRALQERKVRPLGGAHEIDVDIRLVCATNGDLASLVADGQFREDLYHRINEFTIYMPELKDRGADIFLFADLFIKHANADLGRDVIGLDDKASERIASYAWPGNLRELNNVMRRATLLAKGKHIGLSDLERSMAPSTPTEPLALHDELTEQQRIEAALRATGGNKSKAAQLLAVDRKTLYNKMKRYGMD
ncbi:sigma-54 dependent transcriptional regulator [Hallella sp.]|uniref:sigma-54-dependent transcriptional regulator n=1 Tax=Hallella sp. TaxID=2980186 RepID=UPI00283D5BBA|nr:sigma-54 dependent transcriptional regulator [Hallella sp.]MCI7433790.1 sigma-54 dependent transcriptional regulator [Prevotella sp.]MDR3843870.1 sigma-54 dependent transcriptional regulator [Hallella sp.]MDR4000620.1 sigma-54 dependent transcriptional regulator [Hallella sp.]